MSNNLKKLLELYREEVKKYLATHNKMVLIPILLDEKFLKECENCIIVNYKKYNNNWKKKNYIREIDFKKLDIFNYKMLNGCQKICRINIKNNRSKKTNLKEVKNNKGK